MPLKERGWIPDREHPVLNSTAILAKQMKRATRLNRPSRNNNQNITPYGCHPLPYISYELPHPWPHSIRSLLPCIQSPSKIALSHHEWHSSITTLLIWSKLTQSSCSSPFSHLRVLNPASKMTSIHTRSVFIPTKEIYWSSYPLIPLSKRKIKI